MLHCPSAGREALGCGSRQALARTPKGTRNLGTSVGAGTPHMGKCCPLCHGGPTVPPGTLAQNIWSELSPKEVFLVCLCLFV